MYIQMRPESVVFATEYFVCMYIFDVMRIVAVQTNLCTSTVQSQSSQDSKFYDKAVRVFPQGFYMRVPGTPYVA